MITLTPKNFCVKKAHNLQVCLSRKLILEDRLPKKIRTNDGVDFHYVGNIGIGAATVVDYGSPELLETQMQFAK